MQMFYSQDLAGYIEEGTHKTTSLVCPKIDPDPCLVTICVA
jgi:hypothetical protein